MSTRAVVRFFRTDQETIDAAIYHHSDGYPSHMEDELERFLEWNKREFPGNEREDHASYLAFRYCVFLAKGLAYSRSGYDYDGYSFGIVKPDYSDFAYRYDVYTFNDKDERPMIVRSDGREE